MADYPLEIGEFPFRLREQPACHHQFFKTADLQYNPQGYAESDGNMHLLALAHPHTGLQVMCALCGQQRQLWSTGEMLIWRDGQWREKDLNVID